MNELMYLVYFLAFGVIQFFFTWILFILLMWVKKHRDNKLTYLFVPFGIIGWLSDVTFNIVYGTIMFQQLPYFHRGMNIHHITLTHRIKRIFRGQTQIFNTHKRYKMAQFICKYMLEPFDAGHCN